MHKVMLQFHTYDLFYDFFERNLRKKIRFEKKIGYLIMQNQNRSSENQV